LLLTEQLAETNGFAGKAGTFSAKPRSASGRVLKKAFFGGVGWFLQPIAETACAGGYGRILA